METVILDSSQLDIILSTIVVIGMSISACLGFSAGWKGE